LLANNALIRTNIDTKDERLRPWTQTFYSSPKTPTVGHSAIAARSVIFCIFCLVCTEHWTVSACLYSRSNDVEQHAPLVVPKRLLFCCSEKKLQAGAFAVG